MAKSNWKKGLAPIIGLTLLFSSANAGFMPRTANAANETVNVWMTTADQTKLLAEQSSVQFIADNYSATGSIIDVNDSHTYQTMEGFGGTMSLSSAWLIQQKMNATQRDQLLNDLFTSSGIDLNYLRQPIGTSDYSNVGSYTYDDPSSGDDYSLNQFSILKDADIISVLQAVKNKNSSMQVMGSPWTAPPWMKNDRTYNGSYLKYWDSGIYSAYANYFVKYIQAYGAQGIPINAITIQNEPLHTSTSYPSMSMSAGEQRDFIKNYLGPAFSQNNISTKILLFDHNWDLGKDYVTTILNDPAAAQYVDGTAWHCYGEVKPGVQSELRNSFPSKNHYFSECSGGGWSTDFGNNLKWITQNVIIGSIRNWSKNVLLYNIALDTNDGPMNGGCPNCRGIVTINQSNGAYSKNVEYYALGQVSKFVRPGAARIESTGKAGGIETVAFKNPDGGKVLVAVNTGSGNETFKVRWGNQSFSYTLPASAVATFVWSGTKGASPNAAVNGGFESGSLDSWQSWSPSGQAAAHSVDSGGERSGSFKLVHYSPAVYQQTSYQLVNVPNGTYRVSFWARSGGGQNSIQLQVNSYGGGQMTANLPTTAIGEYTRYTISNIPVTTGQISYGIYSNANAGNWAVFDDVEVVRTGN